MANDLSVVAPKLLAQGLMALRENAVMPRLVNRDYEAEAAEKGATVTIPIPSAIADRAVAPAVVPPASVDSAPTQALIPLDQWREAPFHLTDKDVLEAMEGTIPMQASEAVKSLVNYANAFILGKYKGVYGNFGTPATTPFLSSGAGTADATGARKVLNNQLAPLDNRRFVIDPDAEANALNNRAFQDMSFSGSAEGIVEGKLNRKLGFDWFMDQQVPTHTKGVATGTPLSNGGNAVGDISIATDGWTNDTAGILVEGDLITFAGDTQTYVVTADVASGSTTGPAAVPIAPALQATLADGVAITVVASHVVNLAFHRDAFAFASRPLKDSAQGLGSIIETATDPVSGLSLRLEISRQHKQTQFSYDILFGAALVRRELACRLYG
jgi:P22 coat protein - gene protein 5